MQQNKFLPLILSCLVVFGAYLTINEDFSPANEVNPPIKQEKLVKFANCNGKSCNNITNVDSFCNCGRKFNDKRPVGSIIKRIEWRIFHPFGGKFRCN